MPCRQSDRVVPRSLFIVVVVVGSAADAGVRCTPLGAEPDAHAEPQGAVAVAVVAGDRQLEELAPLPLAGVALDWRQVARVLPVAVPTTSKAMACSQFLIGAREGASGGRWYSPRREGGRPQAAQRTLERCEACRRRAALAVVWAGFGAAVPLG